jgi:hypothetical protein
VKKLHVTTDPFEVAKDLQYAICSTDDAERVATMASSGQVMLNELEAGLLKRSLTVHTMAAYTLNKAGIMTGKIIDNILDEGIFKGRFLGLQYLHAPDNDPPLDSFMAQISPTHVIAPTLEQYPDGTIPQPLLIPVLGIQSVEEAA